MQFKILTPDEAEALSDLLYAALPFAEARDLGEPVAPSNRARVLARLCRWTTAHPIHPADLLGIVERLRRAG